MSNVNFDTYETVNYLAGMKILLGDEVLEFADGPVLSIAVEGDEADWSSLVLLITRAMEAAPVRLTSDEADHHEVFDLMSRVFECKNAGRYADLGEFLGFEVS